MKKIGIITYHHAINYGANLQAYALWKTLKNQNHDVEIIDYRPFKAIKQYFFGSSFISHLIKAPKVEKFLNTQIKLGKPTTYSRTNLPKQCQDYDVLITGSDEVWNINSFRGFDPSYFLDFSSQEGIKKISYAASFGSTTTLGIHQEEISKLLGQFSAISVRDLNSLKLVTEEGKCQAQQVLDPTFILGDYSEIMSDIKYDKKYLLIYGNVLNPQEADLIKALAKRNGLEILSVGCNNKIADKNLVTVSVSDWLGYYNRASYVVTSFYHGTIFAILFGKPFTFLSRANKSIKVNDLLKSIGLENRIFAPSVDLNKFVEENLEIDYTPTVGTLSASISSSRKFLFDAIHDG
ncbi:MULTISPECIES: polysaccharide pyruvyl transferase family protein [unclassified Anabaena]|uniref:polysaccharide pyruvyl transferase family protein n=1 Tax=unclassified Anabaena TaxID=2619674 RepID=UPI00082E3AD1|nr:MULTISPECIES: polysaccharide pyruvyl transferase family protein [unclassified Anabaena]